MDFATTRPVTELPLPDRQAIEHLLGGSLADQQQVFIMSFTPGQPPDEAARAAGRSRLQQTFVGAQQHAEQHGITDAQADAAVAEAMDQVRRRAT